MKMLPVLGAEIEQQRFGGRAAVAEELERRVGAVAHAHESVSHHKEPP